MVWFTIENKDYMFHKEFIKCGIHPILFTVKDEKGKLYIAECVNIDKYEYYLCETSEQEIFNMLDGKITTRELFLNKKEMYDIFKAIPDDNATKVKAFNEEWLPKEGYYFTIPKENMRLKGYYNYLKHRLSEK